MNKIIFTGGGTGGHIFPNLAIIDLLKDEYSISYIGSKDSIEEKIVSSKYSFHGITTVKLIRSLNVKNFLIPFKLIKGIIEAKKILKKEKPTLVFSKGGFVSVPVVIAAHSLKIPCLTHESDLSLGLANKIIKNKCKYVLTSFERTAKGLKNGIYTGSPIRKEILKATKNDFIKQFNLYNNKPNLLIFGGSLGSRTINKIIFENIDNLTNQYNVFHIVGKNNMKDIKHPNYYQFDFVNNMEIFLAGADVIITRGGSNALFEICAVKKPMVIIPLSKNESRGDQILNANYFKEKNLAEIILEENLTFKLLEEKIKLVYNNKNDFILNMENFNANGNNKIVGIIKETIKNS